MKKIATNFKYGQTEIKINKPEIHNIPPPKRSSNTEVNKVHVDPPSAPSIRIPLKSSTEHM